MNQRIRELAEQATIEEHDGFRYLDKQKFAELIVKEYEQFLPEICPWAGANEEGPTKGWHVAFVARKHFGVE